MVTKTKYGRNQANIKSGRNLANNGCHRRVHKNHCTYWPQSGMMDVVEGFMEPQYITVNNGSY
jgi:hypothetical protein